MTTASALPAARPPLMRRVTIAATAGNTTETYDYAAYGYLAAIIAKLFFPGSQPGAALLPAFAVFGVAFVVRPPGSLLFGSVAGKLGRRPSLVASLVPMAVSAMAIGFGFAAAAALGGPALYISQYLVQLTGDNRAPALFLMSGATASLGSAVLARQRKPQVLAPLAVGGPAGETLAKPSVEGI